MTERRALVTGGAGFIGSHVVDALLQKGWAVAVLDDFSTGRFENVPASAELFRADIRDRAAVNAAFQAFRPSAVAHLAAQSSVAASVRDPRGDADVNVAGGLNVLEAARAHGVGAFAFASTGGAMYGHVPSGERASVRRPSSPLSPYAIGKLALEYYLAYARESGGLKTWVLRLANVYGPRQRPDGEAGVVAIFADRLRRGEPLRLHGRERAGDDGCVRDYVYVGDAARAFVAALEGRLSEPLCHVCTGRGTTTRALAEAMARLLSLPARIVPAPPRPGDVRDAVLAPGPEARALGVPTSLDEGLARTLSAGSIEARR